MLRYLSQLVLLNMFHKSRLHTNHINHNPNKNFPRRFRMHHTLEEAAQEVVEGRVEVEVVQVEEVEEVEEVLKE